MIIQSLIRFISTSITKSKISGILILFSISFLFPSLSFAAVYINEFYSYSNDWIELYATTDTDISGWTIHDTSASIVKTIGAGTVIGPGTNSYFILEITNNRLNMDIDRIDIRDTTGTTIDSISYGATGEICAPQSGESVGRQTDGGTPWVRFSTVTKGVSNSGASELACPTITTSPTATPTPTPSPTPTPTPTPSPTATAKPTTKPTSTPKPSTTPTPTIPPLNSTTPPTSEPEVLGVNESVNEPDKPNRSNLIPYIFIGLGVTILFAALYPFAQILWMRYNGNRSA